jgi:transcriptional regulator NrdR family protein
VIGLVFQSKQRERQKKATCPHCGHTDSLVCPSGRETEAPTYNEYLKAFVRYRRCQGCKQVFRTGEFVLK